jgi:Secretion system C-terminal sorting domain
MHVVLALNQSQFDMKKLYAILAFAMLLTATAFAQTFSTIPNDSVFSQIGIDRAADQFIYFVNTSNDPIYLKWQVTTQTFPSQWIVQICDNRVCRNMPFAGTTMAPVMPGDSGYLKLTTAPNNTVPGDLLVQVNVFDSLAPNIVVPTTFQVRVAPTATVDKQLRAQLSISPNPTSDYIHLRARTGTLTKGHAKLYDLSGRIVLTQPIGSVQAAELDLRALETGIYMLRYETKLGTVTEKVMVAR